MQYSRVYAGPDGESHFETVDVPMEGDGPSLSKSIHADRIHFIHLPAGTFQDWHPAPRRQFVITLAGGADIIAGDGQVRRVGPGTAMLLEDVTGKGHQTKVLEGPDRIMMIVSLAEQTEAPAAASGRGAAAAAPRQAGRRLSLPRVNTTPDGGTSFDELEIELFGDGPWQSRSLPAGRITFVQMPAGMFGDWHTERRRQFVNTLEGGADIVATNGDKRPVGPGTAMMFEDVSGKGHQTVVRTDSDRIAMIVSLGE